MPAAGTARSGVTSRRAANRSSATFKGAQQFLVKRFIEVVRDNESAFVDSKNRVPILHGHKTCHGLARAGNDDVLPEDHLPQQPGEMGLRFVDADVPHDDPYPDQGDDQVNRTPPATHSRLRMYTRGKPRSVRRSISS